MITYKLSVLIHCFDPFIPLRQDVVPQCICCQSPISGNMCLQAAERLRQMIHQAITYTCLCTDRNQQSNALLFCFQPVHSGQYCKKSPARTGSVRRSLCRVYLMTHRCVLTLRWDDPPQLCASSRTALAAALCEQGKSSTSCTSCFRQGQDYSLMHALASADYGDWYKGTLLPAAD